MKRLTLEELAAGDRQLRRFLKQAEAKKRAKKPASEARGPAYEPNHVPETRDLEKAAAAAIDACVRR